MNYWKSRELQERVRLLDKSIFITERQIIAEYRRVQSDLLTKMQNLYYKIQSGEFIANDIYRYNGYYDIVNDIQTKLTALGISQQNIMSDRFQSLYEQNYDIVGTPVKHLVPNQQRVKEVINGVWVNDGKNWSNRLWSNQKLLAEKLENTLVDNITRGASVDELTKNVMRQFNQSYNNSSRLVRTESSHIWNSSAIDKYRDAGIEFYKVISEPDCCDKCTELNNQEFPLDETVIPMHPFVVALLWQYWTISHNGANNKKYISEII